MISFKYLMQFLMMNHDYNLCVLKTILGNVIVLHRKYESTSVLNKKSIFAQLLKTWLASLRPALIN